MPSFDLRVPAVLLRVDRNPFHHGTLGAVRSLGRAGIDVHLVADCAGGPVGASRFVHRMHPPPAPGAAPADIALALRRVAARVARPAVLIPMDDASAVAVDRLRGELVPRFLLPPAPPGLAERVADKAELAAVCAAAGIAHPATLVPDGPAQAAAAVRRLGLPVVAKWSRPWLLPAGSDLRSTTLLYSAQEARALSRRAGEAGSRLLLQAFLPPVRDGDWFFHGYVDRAGAVHGGGPGRKQRAWPRGAGLTAVGRWTPNPAVRAPAERLVSVLGYRGIFDLDFRRDAASGAYHLLDFNPRPGAQFRLFADGAGLDVVRAQHLDLTHRPLPAPEPRPGRTFVVENYAPFAAVFRGGTERAWHARDDLAPGVALWALWSRHVGLRAARRLRERVRPAGTAPAADARIVRPAAPPEPPVTPPDRSAAPLDRPVAPLDLSAAFLGPPAASPGPPAVPFDVSPLSDDEKASSH